MYIKQVLIEGFKSYRELVAPEPFSPKVNCVVGANGSGKTNFFYAIRFVLSDLFQNMRQEDRQSLLHEGTGGQVHSAFVEIVFDNKDNRIPVDKDEVRLRRTIGLRKDEYWLDKKHITKTEVMNLLESAGFSRSNPYYVVQQGKIAQLSLMKDSERLALLKEIGGARVYEERRKESLKLMVDADGRRKQVEEVVSFIEERLKELDAEKEELKKYQALDKQRRSMEYTIFDKELHDAKEELEKIEAKRKAAQEKSGTEHQEAQKRHEELKGLEKQLKGLVQERQGLRAGKEAAEAQRNEAVQLVTRLELDAKELVEKSSRDAGIKARVEEELAAVEVEIAESNSRLEAAQGELATAAAAEAQVAQSLGDNQKQLDGLYQKQGRKTTFASKVERDRWLTENIRTIDEVIRQKTSQVDSLDSEITTLRGRVRQVEQEQQQKQQEVQAAQDSLRTCQEKIAAQEAARNALSTDRKKMMKEEAECGTQIRRVMEDQRHANALLAKSTPRDIRRGLESVERIVAEHCFEGVYGPLLNLIDCQDVYQTAVEVTAGNSLFNVVVENDEIAAKLVHYLNLQKGGRITFIPLNRANAPRVEYPQGDDVEPLLNKLSYDKRFHRAFGQVFGRTLLCKDIHVAADVARSGDFDCITLEGSRVERKGAMTGGHHDPKRSKMKLMQTVKGNREELQALEERKRKAGQDLIQLDQRISACMGQLEQLKAQQVHEKAQAEQLRADDKALSAELASVRSQLANKEKTVEGIRTSMVTAEAEKREKQAELRTEFGAGLTEEEKGLMGRLPGEIERLKKDHLKCSMNRMQVEGTISSIETSLSENLLRRQDELQGQLVSLQLAFGGSGTSSNTQQELEAARAALSAASEEYQRVVSRAGKVEAEMHKLKQKKEGLKRVEEENERRLQDESKILEQLLNERHVQQHKKEELNKKIRDLGVLPADAFDKYQKHSLKELHRMLHRCNENLKKFSHVNKKALDQYTSFTEQREEMHRRLEELDQSDRKIKELIEVLDHRKDEALERTFKQVSRNFRETFEELVPGGLGSLVMVRKKQGEDAVVDEDDDDEYGRREAEGDKGVDKYSGVRVKVAFTGRGETQSMKQLSGGQKTVVALCLIFAIQRCDPAPFYLFDEIDAALDPQYRAAVANMIRGQADTSSTQFILTTFRPELVKIADCVYSVEHRNRVSSVRVVNQEAGLRFVETDQGAQTTRS